jgi:hypothetical protein
LAGCVEGTVDGTTKFAIVCWGVVIAFWIVTAFSVKRTRAQQPLLLRLSYLVLTVVAVLLVHGSARIVNWNRVARPPTLAIGILGDFFVLVGLLIAIWARVTLAATGARRCL